MLPSRAACRPACQRASHAPNHASRAAANHSMHGRRYSVRKANCEPCSTDRANVRSVATERFIPPSAAETKALTEALRENTKELKALRGDLKIRFPQTPITRDLNSAKPKHSIIADTHMVGC